MSPADWEKFIHEWASSLKTRYADVHNCSGAGDMGRDIICYYSAPGGPWDNYQCKHYEAPLAPSDIWVELGKLAVYTKRGEYSAPENYYFVGPRGVGPTLLRLLENRPSLNQGLFANWDKKCRDQLGPLTPDLRSHFTGMGTDFAALSPIAVLEQHAKTPWHAARFGGGLPPRPAPASPPAEVAATEATYVAAVLRAYSQRLNRPINAATDLTEAQYVEHFKRCRREFYSAESLRAFSRDIVPPGTYEELLADMESGIADVLVGDHHDGYARLIAVLSQARNIELTANALISLIKPSDRGGMCHQLANEGRVKWAP